MEQIHFTANMTDILDEAMEVAKKFRHEFFTPEHVLHAIILQPEFDEAARMALVRKEELSVALDEYIANYETMDEGPYEVELSQQMQQMLHVAQNIARRSGHKNISVVHILCAMLGLDESYAAYLLRRSFGVDAVRILAIFSAAFRSVGFGTDEDLASNANVADEDNSDNGWNSDDEDNEGDDSNYDTFSMMDTSWLQLVTCLNDNIASRNPLIGREEELERTIHILCRKDKNNPLHIGESGVGKTALVYGLAARIVNGNVPDELRDSKIFALDLGALVAGAQMRGEFEKRLQMVIDGVQREGNGIIYIDDIHNLIGAGQTGEGAMDASDILRPYLESGEVRFIGSTTYQDFNRYMVKRKGVVRRFQQIDVAEPTVDETVKIIEGLKEGYEKYHKVRYTAEAVRYAVEKSHQLITERFLPDKAIDIVDEAGAYRKLHPLMSKSGKPKQPRYQTVDVSLMSEILAKVCKIDAKALAVDNNSELETLADRISKQIYGQDEAVRCVVEAVQMSKAGLLDVDKPLASLLFVGPTGVGKTEVCKVLAKELGVSLVRFDMSEYTEKHTVAKLIGSPAGYVGYDDGGLLTDAVRKTPNCVLLFDEIEKAHPDIYNILLQVMDYARLTDSKGNKADFKNVVFVMTSNAGAQYASQGTLGFGNNSTKGDAMLQSVKKTFKPEFINRLSGTVVFNDMDMKMAGLILDKKLQQLEERLKVRSVTLQLEEEARAWLLKLGFTKQYGAREIDRVIQARLNPILMREILFGKLKKGGIAVIKYKDNDIFIG